MTVTSNFSSTADGTGGNGSLGGGGSDFVRFIGARIDTGHTLIGKSVKTIVIRVDRYPNWGTSSDYVWAAVYDSDGNQKGSNSSQILVSSLTSYVNPPTSSANRTFTFATAITIADGDRIGVTGTIGGMTQQHQLDVWGSASDTDSYTTTTNRLTSVWGTTARDFFMQVSYDEPPNIEENTIFEETNTRKYFFFQSGLWVEE